MSSSEVELALRNKQSEVLSTRVKRFIASNPEGVRFELKSHRAFESVTLKKVNGSYARQPFSPGDQFTLVDAYRGKKNDVYVFWTGAENRASRNVGPHSKEYTQAEFTDTTGRMNLVNFGACLDTNFAGDIHVAPVEEPELDQRVIEAARAEIGYGTW